MNRFTGASLADLNGDGLKDLLVAESCGEPVGGKSGPGGIKYYKNTGTLGNPIFTFQNYIDDSKGNKIEHLYLRAQFFDMDNDGLLDIVTGENDYNGTPSELRFYRNIGTLSDPIFDTAVVLMHIDGSEIPADYAIHFGIADIDNDGVKDILLNARHHNVQNWSNWQYEAKIGYLRGYLPQTNNTKFLNSTLFQDAVFTNDGIIKYNGLKEVKIYNAAGKIVDIVKFQTPVNCIKLELKNISKGIYFIKLSGVNKDKILKLKK